MNFSFAQKTSEEKQIDSLIAVANQLYMEGKTKELLSVSEKIIDLSEDSEYDKGLVYGYYYIADCYLYIDKYKESLHYVKKTEKYADYLEKDLMHKSRIYLMRAYNYEELDLYSLASKNFHLAINTLEKIERKNSIDSLTLSTTYASLRSLYDELDLQDSAYYYLNKEKHILQKIKLQDSYIEKSSSFVGLGNYHLHKKKFDSADYYYQKSLALWEDQNHPYKIEGLIGFANLKFQQEKYEDALDYYEKALLVTPDHEFFQRNIIYKNMSEIHHILGNSTEAKKYYDLYFSSDNKFKKIKKIERDQVVNQVLQHEKERSQKITQKRTRILFIVLFVVASILVALFFYLKNKRKKILQEKESIIHQKEKEAIQLQKETQQLKLKVNDSFEEIVQLAKENHPEFFTRFQEVYPNFVAKLIEINSKIRISELTLCAYIYLGFSAKDIALYTYKSVYTIRSRKYTLRKKLNITSDENLELWMKNLV